MFTRQRYPELLLKLPDNRWKIRCTPGDDFWQLSLENLHPFGVLARICLFTVYSSIHCLFTAYSLSLHGRFAV
jgi:hypothetical protein